MEGAGGAALAHSWALTFRETCLGMGALQRGLEGVRMVASGHAPGAGRVLGEVTRQQCLFGFGWGFFYPSRSRGCASRAARWQTVFNILPSAWCREHSRHAAAPGVLVAARPCCLCPLTGWMPGAVAEELLEKSSSSTCEGAF